jgi:DNA-binding NarL/FixJ family response regulator
MKTPKKTAAAKERKRILIVDDHPITRQGLRGLLSQEPDFMICGEEESAAGALTIMKSAQPDVVLADLTLVGKSGLEFIKDLRALHPETVVLAVSMHDETIYAERVLRAGARGYIMKSEGGAKLVKAIRHVLQGNIYVSEKMSARILGLFAGLQARGSDSPLGRLTDREFEVFHLIGQGLATREIGKRLHLSPKTVDTHRLNIKAKLDITSLPELMQYAVRWTASEELG